MKDTLNKPTWMTTEAYQLFRGQLPDVPVCRHCDSTDDLTIDHITPRALGGSNAISNLQVLCRRCNSSKGVNGDSYWSRDLYWDREIDVERLRTAQRIGAWDPIVMQYREFFGRPWSQINGRLYLLGWVVGAGKTLGIPTLAFALNAVARAQNGPHCRRIDKVLVLCKEQAIRDATALALGGSKNDAESDLVRFGIIPTAPEVLNLQHSGQFNEADIANKHVVVSCIQMLFDGEGRDQDWATSLRSMLAHFPLIVIDEPHWAHDQVMRIVDEASSSLVFGTTGTPIYGSGKLMERMVLLSTYSYQQAIEHDQSMKLLPEFSSMGLAFEEIDITSADALSSGQQVEIKSTREASYDKQMVALKSVCESVIRHVEQVDGQMRKSRSSAGPLFAVGGDRWAPHREGANRSVDPTLTYDMHAMISVENVNQGKQAVKILNDIFESNRGRYPVKDGYRAALVHSFAAEAGNKAQPLTNKHEWMRIKNDPKLRGKHRVDSQSARFLVVIGIGREGVDNPYCGVIGVARKVDSLVEIVQRVVGRQIRGVQEMQANGKVLRVPFAEADTVKIITHAAYDNRHAIERGVTFMLNMREHFGELPTVQSLIDGTKESDGLQDKDIKEEGISQDERIAIAGKIIGEGIGLDDDGIAVLSGPDLDVVVEETVEKWGGESPERRKAVQDWVDTVISDPELTELVLKHGVTIRERPIVMREYLKEPTGDELFAWIKRSIPTRVAGYGNWNELPEVAQGAFLELYLQADRSLRSYEPQSSTSLKAIRNDYRQTLYTQMNGVLSGDATGGVSTAVNTAIQRLFNTSDAVTEGGKWDVPQAHYILTDLTVKRELMAWCRNWLIDKGYAPAWQAYRERTSEVEHGAA